MWYFYKLIAIGMVGLAIAEGIYTICNIHQMEPIVMIYPIATVCLSSVVFMLPEWSSCYRPYNPPSFEGN